MRLVAQHQLLETMTDLLLSIGLFVCHFLQLMFFPNIIYEEICGFIF